MPSKEIIKQAVISARDSILEAINSTIAFLSQPNKNNSINVLHEKLRTQLVTALSSLMAATPSDWPIIKKSLDCLVKAKTSSPAFQNNNALSQKIDAVGKQYQTQMSSDPFNRFLNNIKANPENPGWFTIGFDLMGFPEGKYVAESLGDWSKQWKSKDGTVETLIFGKDKAWNLLKELSPFLFEAHETFPKSHPLFAQDETLEARALNAETYPLSVQIINAPAHLKKFPKQGIQLTFDPKDVNFVSFRDYVLRAKESDGLGLAKSFANPSSRTIDIFDQDQESLARFSKKLHAMGYADASVEMNKLIEQLTGASYGAIWDKISANARNEALTAKKTLGAIKRNEVEEFNVPYDENFHNQIVQEYPLAFAATLPAAQREAQSRGIHFMLSRHASVIADAPGTGKTSQSICGADKATKMWKNENNDFSRVLFFTPNGLLDEHWISDFAKDAEGNPKLSKPAKYLGEGEIIRDENGIRDRVHIVSNLNSWLTLRSSPRWNEVKWVVVPYSAISQTADRTKLAKELSDAVEQKVFAAAVFDELQMQKDVSASRQDASETIKSIESISAKSIVNGQTCLPHRVALSGTPADNSPADFYALMRSINHPLLFSDYVRQQDRKGFVKQFMGSESLDKYEPDDQHENAHGAIDELINWATGTTPEMRDANMSLFSETFIRRTKQQMRPDMPPKATRKAHNVNVSVDELQRIRERLGASGEDAMALATEEKALGIVKVPHTVNRVLEILKADNRQRVFVVTCYPECADSIRDSVNQQFGAEVAKSVHGKMKSVNGISADEQKSQVASEFKDPNSTLRVAVYTLGIGSVGLNFPLSKYVIFNDFYWNPMKNIQTEDRIHRIDMAANQTATPEYIVADNTPDSYKYDRVQRKEVLNTHFHSLLERASEGEPASSLADDFVIDIIREQMENFNLERSVVIDSNTRELGTIRNILDKKIAKLQGVFEQQRAGRKKKRKPPVPLPVAADTQNWYRQMKQSSLQYRHLW